MIRDVNKYIWIVGGVGVAVLLYIIAKQRYGGSGRQQNQPQQDEQTDEMPEEDTGTEDRPNKPANQQQPTKTPEEIALERERRRCQRLRKVWVTTTAGSYCEDYKFPESEPIMPQDTAQATDFLIFV
jgi:hypothetical protein